MRGMGMTASEYWKVILVETWKAAWSKTRSWAALWAIVIGATGLYLYAVEDWRPLLAWIVPLGLLILFFLGYLPLVIYRTHRNLERRLETGAPDGPVGKFFHTFLPGDDSYQYQGEVLRESNGRLFVRLYDTMGDPSTQQFLTDGQVASARFYDTADEWRDAGERMNRRAARRF
jgi:hypothetical protein